MQATASASTVRYHLPPLACDCHMHVFGPIDRYPPAGSRNYTPVEAPLAAWRTTVGAIGVQRVVVVQPSVYGADNTCLIDALRELGPLGRGVAGIDESTSDMNLHALGAAGVRGVRLNPKSIGSRDLSALRRLIERTAERIAPLRWHLQLYADLALVGELADTLGSLPIPVVLDHMGGAAATDDEKTMAPLLRLLSAGACWIKLSAPYRVSKNADDFSDSLRVARTLVRCNPGRLVWGSDWPHTASHATAPSAAPPPISFRQIEAQLLLRLLVEATGDEEIFRQVLVKNPEILYRFV
jgi:predicted TIM-barrel fold metal-dependent hydrolase